MTSRIAIDGKRLLQRLDDFARIGATPAGGVNRQALSPEDRASRRLLADLALQRGFRVFQDSMANLFIRREGRLPARAPLVIGSHLDSQPTGGRFDGALGTLAAFEVMESIADAGIETDLSLEVVAWTNEEGSRFAPGAMGSMAFAAGAIPDAWSDLRGRDGSLFVDELSATLQALPEAEMRPLGFPICGYLELHIEQGPSLERENIPIGIVHGIQGTRWLEVTIKGQAAHAGTTALEFRRDPMAAAVAALEPLYKSAMPSDQYARFTVGRIAVEPGAVNAIPGSVTFSIDLRHPETAVIDALEDRVRLSCDSAAAAAGCESELRQIFDMPPAAFSEDLLACLDRAAASLGLKAKHMLSGAFHDALFVNRVAPAAMIFVPCRDGLSHNEAEYVEPEHSIAGARMLLAATMEAIAVRA
ncbi:MULTISPECIES: Zn-dependent hydrolase [unclassified Ensifer]|uniref:Zn-dependent hydrolase n=1 Tax=unclassified Ensifer TaxID=2633371 RepID=UPI0008139D11|nr:MULTISPECIES: Zn-dependent hydrolase [unclassified Ensifer]OCP00649.1 Zn-dependent hydrolase [Ensifer sp. LC14]OCP07874.1 Zn-dependent hydrolase [Ensifer sp. LC11]OCP08565.1 Zn-dependent hydrolase [Ensifer sp. LC13]OCP32143.1 Zn-dependent hydrolase [Ensifer sp. LC499]